MRREVSEGCRRTSGGKPANMRQMAQCLVDDPSHRGMSASLAIFADLARQSAAGFEKVRIDHRVELRDAIRMGEFASAHDGFAEVARRRAHTQPSPPRKVLSSIHKAKGLECDRGLVMACDRARFSGTTYSRCKLYVALSRAKRSLTLVASESDPSPLFRLA